MTISGRGVPELLHAGPLAEASHVAHDCAWPGPLRPVFAAPPAPPHAGAVDADPTGTWPNTLPDGHFVLKWGDEGNVDAADAGIVLDALGRAWVAEVEVLGYPEPYGSDTFLLDVFLGDTGDGLPDTFGARGYEGRYEDGRPYIVLHPGLIEERKLLEVTAVHELFHALQDNAGSDYRFATDSPSGFWYEATAMWMEQVVVPETDDWYRSVWAYASTIREPLRASFPVDNSARGNRAYGLAVLPWFLAERLDDDLIRASWTTAGEPDVLVVLAAELAARGEDPDQVFSDFAAKNAFWDYPDRSQMFSLVDAHRDHDGDMYRREPALPEAPVVVPPAEGPAEGGTVYVRVPLSGFEEKLAIEAEGDEFGDAGSTARWDLRVVLGDGEDPALVYAELPVSRGVLAGELEPGGLRVLVLAATVWGLGEGERAGLRYTMRRIVPEPVTLAAAGAYGGGCRSGDDASTGAGLLILLGVRRQLGRQLRRQEMETTCAGS